jgi:hypothetical protein
VPLPSIARSKPYLFPAVPVCVCGASAKRRRARKKAAFAALFYLFCPYLYFIKLGRFTTPAFGSLYLDSYKRVTSESGFVGLDKKFLATAFA